MLSITTILDIAPPFTHGNVLLPLDEAADIFWALQVDAVDRVGNAIPATLETGRIDFGLEIDAKRLHSLDVTAQSTGTTLEAALSLNGKKTQLKTALALGSNKVAADALVSGWLFWARGNWDAWNWADEPSYTHEAHKRFPVHAKGRDMQLTLQSSHAQDTQISAIDIFYIVQGGVK